MASSVRRQARIIALQTLYEADSTAHPVEEVLERSLEPPGEEGPDPDAFNQAELLDDEGREFTRSLVRGVVEHRDDLDRIIAKSAPNWPIDQMSRIDKNILRLAIFEILFDNGVPLKAAINEAVELGKRYGSDSSSRFINGVLGTIAAQQPARGKASKDKDRKEPKGRS